METFFNITMSLAVGLYVFWGSAASTLFTRCFYDPGFQWNRKLALHYLLTSIIFALFLCIHEDVRWCFRAIVLWAPIPEESPNLTPFLGLALIMIPLESLTWRYGYKGKRRKGAARSFWLTLVFMAAAYVIGIIGAWYIAPDWSYLGNAEYALVATLTYLCLGGSFALLFLYIYFRLHKRGIFLRFGRRERIFAVVYLIVLLAVFCIFVSTAVIGDSEPWAFFGICCSVAIGMPPVFFYYLCISRHYQERTAIQQTYIEAELAHFQQYQHSQEETARFRHDIKNNLLCVSDMLQQGKSEEASAYLQDLLQSVESLSRKYVTGDTLLDSIVAVKAQIMKQHNIQFALDGVLAGGIAWKPVDICNVFANALDNAIEACQKLPPEKRSISMNIRSTPQFWFVTIENSVLEAVDTEKLFQMNGGYTSKANAAQHGIGTYSMKHTVESYGDMIKAECTDEVFTLEIMIDKSSPA